MKRLKNAINEAQALMRKPGYGVKGKMLWGATVSINGKTYHAYVSDDGDEQFGGVIDRDDNDETVFGDTFKTKQDALAAVQDELKAMRNSSF